MFGVDLSGLGVTTRPATTTTTTKSSSLFNLNDLLQMSGLGSGSQSQSTSSSASILSLMNAFSGKGGPTSSLSTLAALLPLLPFGQQLFHSDTASPQLTLGLISSLPQIVSLIDSFTNYKLPVTNVSEKNWCYLRNICIFNFYLIKVE